MKRTSFFLPDDLRDRLAAESQRSGVPVAELVRRYLDAMAPPITIGFGGLRKYLDRQGSLKVLVLSAREGKFLVEPDGKDFSNIQIWVDANLVRFEEPQAVQPTLFRHEPKLDPVADMLRMNVQMDEPEEPPK
jgi:hypothetical protein